VQVAQHDPDQLRILVGQEIYFQAIEDMIDVLGTGEDHRYRHGAAAIGSNAGFEIQAHQHSGWNQACD
jgi:hypothetical protein